MHYMIFMCSLGSQLTDAEINPEDYTIYRQLAPRLSLYAKLVTENVRVYYIIVQ